LAGAYALSVRNDVPDRAAIVWEGYRPGVEITLVQSKTGNPVTLPLFEEVPGEGGGVERVPLYPELAEELARSRAATRSATGPIVVEERSGKRYVERRMSNVHRKICDAAGLPKDMTFTGFRHGGITEIGDAGEDDVRPVSGHKTLAVTRIYNKANAEKARRIAGARRRHIAAIGALDEARTK
jgi:integrase